MADKTPREKAEICSVCLDVWMYCKCRFEFMEQEVQTGSDDTEPEQP